MAEGNKNPIVKFFSPDDVNLKINRNGFYVTLLFLIIKIIIEASNFKKEEFGEVNINTNDVPVENLDEENLEKEVKKNAVKEARRIMTIVHGILLSVAYIVSILLYFKKNKENFSPTKIGIPFVCSIVGIVGGALLENPNFYHWGFIGFFIMFYPYLYKYGKVPNMPKMSGEFGESFENKKTAIFLFVSAMIIITLMMTMCETSPVDVEGIPVTLDTDGLRKSMPKWITEKNLSWTIFLAGSVLCVIGYVVSNQTRSNELGIGFLALSLIGMFVLTTIFDKILGLLKPKQEEFKNVKEKFLDLEEEKRKGDNHQTENFYTKIDEDLAISIVLKDGVIRNEVRKGYAKVKSAITVSQNSLAIRIPTEVKKGYGNHYLWYTGAVIDKTLNEKINVHWVTNEGNSTNKDNRGNRVIKGSTFTTNDLTEIETKDKNSKPFIVPQENPDEENYLINRSQGTEIAGTSSGLFSWETDNMPRRFLLLSKEKDPIQALLKGNGKGYVENPKSTDTRVSQPINSDILSRSNSSSLTIHIGILSEGLYYLHSYNGNPKVLPNDDGFEIKTGAGATAVSKYTKNDSGEYTATKDAKFLPVQPFKLMITSSNKVNTSLINNVTGVTMIVMILYAFLNIVTEIGNFKQNINLGNGVSIILFILQFLALFQINAKSPEIVDSWKNIEKSKTDLKIRDTIFTIATVAYVLRILQVSGLLFSIQQEYQS